MMSPTDTTILTREQVDEIRIYGGSDAVAGWDLPMMQLSVSTVWAICDSHEALRAEVEKLKGERDRLRAFAASTDAQLRMEQSRVSAAEAQVAALREKVQELQAAAVRSADKHAQGADGRLSQDGTYWHTAQAEAYAKVLAFLSPTPSEAP